MSDVLDYGFDDQTEDDFKKPVIGTYQKVRIDECEYKKSDSGWRYFKIKGVWVDFNEMKFYSSIFIGQENATGEDRQKSINQFLRNMSAFGFGKGDIGKGKSLDELALDMLGREAIGRVGKDRRDDDKEFLVPTSYKALDADGGKAESKAPSTSPQYGRVEDRPSFSGKSGGSGGGGYGASTQIQTQPSGYGSGSSASRYGSGGSTPRGGYGSRS